MNPTNALGIRVAALTSALLVVVFGLYLGGRFAWRSFTTSKVAVAPEAVQTPTIPLNEERTDADGDQLPDQFEAAYRTDKTKADTDGDGTNDFAEIEAGRDPAVAGIADEVKPITGPAVTDQTTYTGRYLSLLPEDTSRDDILNQNRLEAFVNLHKGPLLPSPAPGTLKTTDASGKEAVETYLHAIASSHNKAIFVVTNSDIEAALKAHLGSQPQALTDIIGKLEKNIATLTAVPAPTEMAGLHQKLVAASQALRANTKLLQTTSQDFVGGLIASKNIEDLGPIFQEIATEIDALETKYSLE